MLKHNDLTLVALDSMNKTHFQEIEIINSLLEKIIPPQFVKTIFSKICSL